MLHEILHIIYLAGPKFPILKNFSNPGRVMPNSRGKRVVMVHSPTIACGASNVLSPGMAMVYSRFRGETRIVHTVPGESSSVA